MHRCYVPPENCGADTILLPRSEAHHARHVLRLREHDHVAVLDGAGTELQCEVSIGHGDALALRVLGRKTIPPPPASITLLQAIPKGKIVEGIIQKATELGVTRIVPILTDRVVTQLDADGAEAKADKWQHVAIEAIKQCGSAWLPTVERPVSLREFLTRHEHFELPLISSLENGSSHPRAWFNRFVATHQRAPQSVCVWVGPEGDFTAEEYALIKASGALPITLGPLVLRVETASIYCLSVINYELRAPR